MFHLGKSVLAVAAIIVMAGLPPSAAMAKMAAVRHLSTESFSADAGLLHKTGVRPISGAYRASRPAGPGAIAGQHGHGYRHCMHRRHHGGSWFAGQSWFGHHSWFGRNERRHATGAIRPAAAQLSAREAPAPASRPAISAQLGAIAGTNPRAGVTLPEKSYRALIRATYPVALPHKPRIRHVQRQHKATPRLKSAGYSHVRWSSSSGRRNTAMPPYIHRY